MTILTELDAALRELSTPERIVLERHWLAMSREAIDNHRPRVSHVFHVLAVAAAEEGDRRASVLEATAHDLEPVEAGETLREPRRLPRAAPRRVERRRRNDAGMIGVGGVRISADPQEPRE